MSATVTTTVFATAVAPPSGDVLGDFLVSPIGLVTFFAVVIVAALVGVLIGLWNRRKAAQKVPQDDQSVPPASSPVPYPAEPTDAEKKAEEWWKANPNRRKLTVSGACHLQATRGGIQVGSGKEADVTESAVVILAEGKLTAKFRSSGKITWFEYRERKQLTTSVECPAGSTIEIHPDGKVCVDEVAVEGAEIKAVNCQEVSVHREKVRLVCEGVYKVHADCGTASATNCRDASFSGYTQGVAVNCMQVGAHDNAVVYADNCRKVIIMGNSRVKTVRCPDVLHADKETSVWEKG